ncbi:MAG: mechanosensitive ion channel [Gammaproteobacteria bacterium]|nr:mechanosensitive ion channel [Gammaproteobacteria bacterium]
MHKQLNVKRLLNVKIILWLLSFALIFTPMYGHCAVTDTADAFYLDRSQLISQQTELLKNRLSQAENQLQNLQNQQDSQLLSIIQNQTNKQLRNQASLDIAVAKSDLDSLSIELSESQQTINRLEKEIQSVENQLNVYSTFGTKIARNESLRSIDLKAMLTHQQNVLDLEKNRSGYLSKLQEVAEHILQAQKLKYTRINALMKSRTILQLKQRQARSDNDFQQQQSYWLKQLNTLYAELGKVEAAKTPDKKAYANLEREIFYANENANFTYLQMLIVRYQDQLQELRISISHSSSITLLNNASDQVQALTKQLLRLKELLKTRVSILDQRKAILSQSKDRGSDDQADFVRLTKLESQYAIITNHVVLLDKKLIKFRIALEQALQYELSSRQGLPGFDTKAWLDLGAEIWLVPTLTYHVVKTLSLAVIRSLENIKLGFASLLLLFELALVVFFAMTGRFLTKIKAGMAEHEHGHINLKRLCVVLLRRSLVDIAAITNVVLLFSFLGIPQQNSSFLINLALIWLFFKVIVTMARVCLVETVHDRAGQDVRLYHRLKWTFMVGGLITAATVFVHQLPVIYEVKDLFDRTFLLFLLVVSVLLLRSWEIMPALILPHIDNKHLYFKKVVQLLGLLVPLVLLVNSAIGMFGFVNLVLTISWYESIFLVVLVAYLILRGLLIDGMVLLSDLIIRHVVNGWLWTEAFLKPIDKVMRIGLFLLCWAMLFLFYGWDQQSPVVGRLNTLLHYHLADMLNTTFTPLSIIELGLIGSFLFWAARWTREFVYRLLSARTLDMGLRNSISIFSQYAMIVMGVFICLNVLGIDLKTLTFVATAFSIGIGFGLRDLFNNFACGFLLLIERPLRVGDTVTIGGYEGDVTHIGGRAVTIRTWDHMEVLVPNAEIFSKSFTNWTSKDSIVRSIISLKINRHDNPPDVQAMIYDVLVNYKDVLSDPAPEVLLKELNESLIEFEVRYFVNLRQVRSRLVFRSEVLMAIWKAFERNGIKPPYPHHEVHVNGQVPLLVGPDFVPSSEPVYSNGN